MRLRRRCRTRHSDLSLQELCQHLQGRRVRWVKEGSEPTLLLDRRTYQPTEESYRITAEGMVVGWQVDIGSLGAVGRVCVAGYGYVPAQEVKEI